MVVPAGRAFVRIPKTNLRLRRAAICRLVSPWAARRATCRSCGVSWLRMAGSRRRAISPLARSSAHRSNLATIGSMPSSTSARTAASTSSPVASRAMGAWAVGCPGVARADSRLLSVAVGATCPSPAAVRLWAIRWTRVSCPGRRKMAGPMSSTTRFSWLAANAARAASTSISVARFGVRPHDPLGAFDQQRAGGGRDAGGQLDLPLHMGHAGPHRLLGRERGDPGQQHLRRDARRGRQFRLRRRRYAPVMTDEVSDQNPPRCRCGSWGWRWPHRPAPPGRRPQRRWDRTASAPAALAVGPVDLDHLDAGAGQQAGQAGAVGAGALHPSLGELAVATSPVQQLLITGRSWGWPG
jgi:hypothetical protein